MALFEYYQNMHDVRLKPRLLRSLTKDHLPDENQPFPAPSELSNVVSAIKTHGLLLEYSGDSADPKLLDKWKSAVDAWMERLLLLISSKMLDKRWAGICLLGVTCQECSADRFLDSYSAWFQQLLPQIQQPSESQLVKVASCASLSDLFTRLSGVVSVKKDATSLAGRLIQSVLKILTEDASESVWEGALDLFCTLANFFPSSAHRHYDSAEAVIVSKILSGKCNASLAKKFAYCLALLPRTKGDENSWSLMMQKILLFINVQLNDCFQGLEEETKSSEVMRLLVQPGKDPPPPLGGQLSGEASDQESQMSEKLLFYRVSTLMQCCSMMLTNPYSVQVSVPVRPLLAFVRRVLLVDGSSSQDLLSFMTVAQQESICSELPILHLHSLELLTAIIKGIRSQLLPNAAEVVRLITEYFKRCMLPALRINVYSIAKILLISLGVGMALYLAPEVVNNAFVDLDSFSQGGTTASPIPQSKPATYALQQPNNKKRKHGGSTSDHQNGVGLESKPSKSKLISLQIAALQALEALLTVGGALRSESWRTNVDFLLITVATNVCEGGWANEERSASIISGDDLCSTWADFQLASLRALLASLLAPSRYRPPFLSQALQLFQRGKRETGTKLAEFCAHALLALEVLIHPRALPLTDFSHANGKTFDEGINSKFPENPFSKPQNQPNNPFPRFDEPDPDDELYKSWLGNGDEVEAPVSNTNDDTVEPADELMVITEIPQVPIGLDDVGTSDKSVEVPLGLFSGDAIEFTGVEAESSKGTDDVAATEKHGFVSTSPVLGKGKNFMLENASDTDSIPDIVDADPDSD